MDPTVKIWKGYTHASISVLQSSPAAKFVGDFVREQLIEKEFVPEHNELIGGFWRKVPGHWQAKHQYARFDKKAQVLNIPIAYAQDLIDRLKSCQYTVEELKLNDYELRKIDVKMNPKFHDQEHQIDLIQKCSEPIPGMKGLAMQTGKGKTYSAIKSWVNLGYAGIVIVYGLVDQWIKNVLEYTQIDKDYVYKLQEFNSLALLAQNPNYKPLFFAASYTTMQLFLEGKNNYELLPWSFSEFFKYYGIGVKIIDETHRCFHGITCMDLKTNVPYNLYCSATFTQSGKDAKRIFNKVFPTRIQYGMQAYDKYVNVYVYRLRGAVQEKYVVRKNRGYQHSKYEKELMRSENKLNAYVNETLVPLINLYYINKKFETDQSVLIFCSSVEFIKAVVQKLKAEYPDQKVISYVGENELSDLKGANIIVSTLGKASTGLDIKNLIATINTVSTKAETTVSQAFGRLRKIEGKKLSYVDMYDLNIEAQVRHAEERKALLKRMCTGFYEYDGITDLECKTGEVTGAFI